VTAVAYGEPIQGESRPTPKLRGVILIGSPTALTEFWTLHALMEEVFEMHASPRASATGEREAGSTSSRNTERSSEEE
jgi:hypothetical protein